MGRTEDAIAEGVAIASAAARLVVKNRILVDTIAGGGVFAIEEYIDHARDAVLDLAEESDAAAELAHQLRKRARGRFTDPTGTHDYRDRDKRNLRRRARQSEGVAEQLRAMAADDEALKELVEVAREAAWSDVRSNLDRRLRVEGMRPDQDPDYQRMRESRMEALQLVDLAALSAQARAERESEEPA